MSKCRTHLKALKPPICKDDSGCPRAEALDKNGRGKGLGDSCGSTKAAVPCTVSFAVEGPPTGAWVGFSSSRSR